MRIPIVLVVLVALLLSSTIARADMAWHDAYKSPFSSWGAYMYDQNVKRHLSQRQPSEASRSAPISATDFRRGKGKDVVAQLVAAAHLSETDAYQLARSLRGTIAQLESAGRRDNVANALAIVLALSYVVLETPDFDASSAAALVTTANDALASSPQFRRMSAADRQLMYDSLLLSAAVIAIVHQSGDREASQAIAKQVLKQLVGL